MTRQLSWSYQIFSRDREISSEHPREKERVNDTRDYNVYIYTPMYIYVRKQLRESCPSSAFRGILQTQLRSPVSRRIRYIQTRRLLVIFWYNMFELLHFVFVYRASRTRHSLSLLYEHRRSFSWNLHSAVMGNDLCSPTSSL